MIKYLTSEIDWCEDNFVYCDKIAEMWNSLTSLAFVFFGLFGMYKMPIRTPSVYFFYLNNIFIGFASILFHSTLSIEGQILDEFSILFYIFNGVIYLERYYKKYRKLTVLSIISVPAIVYIYPIMNRLLLFIVGLYVLYLSKRDSKYLGNIDNELFNIIKYSRISFGISLICWIIDYICFLPMSSHFIWHILIAYTCYTLTLILHVVSYNRHNLYKDLLHIKYTKYCKIPYLEFINYHDRYIYY